MMAPEERLTRRLTPERAPMAPETQSLFDAALALPEAERALLAERLLESLSAEEVELTEDELLAELERRRADVEHGRVKPIPWSEVRFEE
jgi:putative addiction module component (TIGR02574 family)